MKKSCVHEWRVHDWLENGDVGVFSKLENDQVADGILGMSPHPDSAVWHMEDTGKPEVGTQYVENVRTTDHERSENDFLLVYESGF